MRTIAEMLELGETETDAHRVWARELERLMQLAQTDEDPAGVECGAIGPDEE